MEGILEKVVSCKSTLNHYTCPKGMMYLYFIIQIFSGNGDFFYDLWICNSDFQKICSVSCAVIYISSIFYMILQLWASFS